MDLTQDLTSLARPTRIARCTNAIKSVRTIPAATAILARIAGALVGLCIEKGAVYYEYSNSLNGLSPEAFWNGEQHFRRFSGERNNNPTAKC